MYFFLFFFTNTPTTEIYTLSLHDALPIFGQGGSSRGGTAPSRQSLEAGQARPRVRSEQPRRPAPARPTPDRQAGFSRGGGAIVRVCGEKAQGPHGPRVEATVRRSEERRVGKESRYR